MNKYNVPQKKVLVLSNNRFSQDSVIVYKKADHSQPTHSVSKTSPYGPILVETSRIIIGPK